MKSRLLALVMFIIAALLPVEQAAAQIGGNSVAAHVAHKKDKAADDGNRPITSVPEPSTILLLGAAAGVVGVRKIWQRRPRTRR